MKAFESMIDWEYVSTIPDLSTPFIREFAHRVNWISISQYHEMNITFAREFVQELSWYDVEDRYDLDEEFIIEFVDMLDIHEMCKHRSFSESFMLTIPSECLDWDEISNRAENLSEAFLATFIPYLNWEFVTTRRPLSADMIVFMNHHNECVDMYNNIWFYKLSDVSIGLEGLAEEDPQLLSEDLINWLYVSLFQEITPSLMRKFGKYLLWEYVSIRCDLTDDVVAEFADMLDWNAICQKPLSVGFIRDHSDLIVMTPQIRSVIKNDHALMALRLPVEVESLVRSYM